MHHRIRLGKARKTQRLVESNDGTYLASSNSRSEMLLPHFIILFPLSRRVSGASMWNALGTLHNREYFRDSHYDDDRAKGSNEPLWWILKIGGGLAEGYCLWNGQGHKNEEVLWGLASRTGTRDSWIGSALLKQINIARCFGIGARDRGACKMKY